MIEKAGFRGGNRKGSERPRRRTACAVALGLAAAIAGAPLSAQESAPAASPDYVENLRYCRAIAEPDERLACYDRAVGDVVTAADAGEVQVIDKEEVEKTRRSLFGFSIPDIGLFGNEDGEAEETLVSEITGIRHLRGDAFIFTIKEGSTWQVQNVPMRLRTPEVGDPVEFEKAALGSYFIRIDGQTGVKGTRIR